MDDKPEYEPFRASELVELEALEHHATDAPWWFDEDERTWRLHGTWGWTPAQHGIPAQPINKQILKAPKRNTPYAEYWPNRQDADFMVAMRNAFPRMLHELKRLYELAVVCACGDPDEDGYQGPLPHCPVHGAMQALQTCTKEMEAVQERLRALEEWLASRPAFEQWEAGGGRG